MPDRADLARLRREMAMLRQRQGQMRVDLEALKAERARYAALFEELPLPTLALDARGRIVEGNAAARRRWCADDEASLADQSAFALFGGRGRVALFEAMRAGATPDRAARLIGDLTMRCDDGHPVPAEAHLSDLPFGAVNAAEFQLVAVERPDLASHARERTLYQSLIDSSAAMIFAFDLDGRCLLANSAIARELGTSRTALEAGALPPAAASAHVFGARGSDHEVLLSGQPRAFYANQPGARGRSFRIDKFPLRDDAGKVYAIGGITSDLSDRVEWQAALQAAVARAERLTYHDPITHLPNRAYLHKVLGSLTLQTQPQPFALLILDIDDLKLINDAHGHPAGDAILRATAGRLEAVTSAGGFAARLGGGEFALILPTEDLAETQDQAARLRARLSEPALLGTGALRSACSIGVAQFPADGPGADALIRAASVALFRAKSRGRGEIACFEPSLLKVVDRRSRLMEGLHRVLDASGFRIAFQPKFALHGQNRTLAGAEALLRWSDPDLGEVGPDEFIALAETIGLVADIDRAMVTLVFEQLARWRRVGLRLHMAINVSTLSLASEGFAAHVIDQLREHRLTADQILFEITETALMEIGGSARDGIEALRAAGVEFAIDDFGTGYSSLRYLQELPLREVKIDRSFVARIGSGKPRDEQLVTGILGLAHSFGLRSVAEGVETVEQFDWLRRAGCDQAQGFYLSHPLDAEAFEARFLSPVD
ncbi:EAL domain-containing protein [Pararhodobacter sp. SW119]|uniref:putative bifunctional diguanylate cyclase/phosphodiesterase n=1 Tax=Pararhodobacter sp. SW119 TaxID=2780075 RepID=UPI001AE05B04|nr:EAL domain-containing protein [Pararhodobacter sp. SW119]